MIHGATRLICDAIPEESLVAERKNANWRRIRANTHPIVIVGEGSDETATTVPVFFFGLGCCIY